MELFPTFLHSQSPVIQTSLTALTLMHLAKSRHDDALAHRGRGHYMQAVQQICLLKGAEDPCDLIRTAMILALYELYAQAPGQDHAWNVHVQAACNLARELHSGMETLNTQDRRRLRTIEVGLSGLAYGIVLTVQFLRMCANLSLEPPSVFRSHVELSTDSFDLLLNTLSEICQFRGGLRHQSVRSGVTWDSTAGILRASACFEKRLLSWYHELQSEAIHPLFMIRPATTRPMPVQLQKPEETMFFTNPSGIPHLLLYWLGMVLVYVTVAEALRGLANSGLFPPSRTIEQRLAKADALCHHFVNRLAQCQSACTGKGTGTAILAAAACQAAQQICPLRQYTQP